MFLFIYLFINVERVLQPINSKVLWEEFYRYVCGCVYGSIYSDSPNNSDARDGILHKVLRRNCYKILVYNFLHFLCNSISYNLCYSLSFLINCTL